MIIHPLAWFRACRAARARRKAPIVRMKLYGFCRWIDGQFISNDDPERAA